MEKAEQEKQTAIVRAQGEVSTCLFPMLGVIISLLLLLIDIKGTIVLKTYLISQAQSAKLIGDAIQQNPAFLTLRKIEVWAWSSLCFLQMKNGIRHQGTKASLYCCAGCS